MSDEDVERTVSMTREEIRLEVLKFMMDKYDFDMETATGLNANYDVLQRICDIVTEKKT